FYLVGRLTSAAFGVGTIAGVDYLGERHFVRNAGLLGALTLALTYGHLASSRLVKADIRPTLFSVWSLYFALSYLRDSRWLNLAICCGLAGIGTATKYYTIAMLVPIAALVVLVPLGDPLNWGSRLATYARRFAFGVACFFAAYFVCSPYNFLDP